MRGKGRLSKKARVVDLTLDEDDEDNARRAAEGAADNLRVKEKHPLLNEPVMEVLFKQFLLLKPRDDGKSALSSLADLRVVCKAWNEGISKVIRKETRVNVKRLTEPYPEGLGWAPVVPIGGRGQDNMLYEYSAPLRSEKTGPFENLDVTLESCADLSSPVLKWFQIMGSSVKRLRLTCYLKCKHETRFIESILKEWCPNLESLTLRGVQYFDNLMHTSHFAKPTHDNLPISLKEFVLCASQISLGHWGGTCPEDIRDFKEIMERQNVSRKLTDFVDDLISYVDQAGERSTTTVTQEKALLSKLVKRPIGFTSLDEMSPLKFGSHVPELFQEKLYSDPGYETDGGLIGQLMKMAAVEKFVVQKANKIHDHDVRLFDELFIMAFYRPNLWRSSLQHFECVGNFSPITSVYKYSSIKAEYIPPRNILSKVGFPLKSLKLNNMTSLGCGNRRLDPESLQKLLKSLAGSLEEFEFGTVIKDRRNVRTITLPKMPKLKVLVVNCDGGFRLVKVTIAQVIGKLPMLEKCVLTLGEIDDGTKTVDFNVENRSFMTLPMREKCVLKSRDRDIGDGANKTFFKDKPKGSCEDDGGRGHPLKELRLLDEYVDGGDLERMTMWFPNLEKAELSTVPESEEDFKEFWEKIGELPKLEQLKVNFSTKMRKGMEYGSYEKTIADNIGKFRDLQSLELEHEAVHTFPLTSGFSKQFAKATKLRFLKFTNFQATFYGQVNGKEEQKIKEGLADVVVELPATRSSRSSTRMTRERSTRE